MKMVLGTNSKGGRRTSRNLFNGGSAAKVDPGIKARHGGINRSLRFMAEHFSRPIQLEDMVKVSRMSRRGFIKAFSQHAGRTPGGVLRQMRIDYAKQLLVEEDLPLKTIASRTGFRSENTFCVAFNRAMGMPPKKYQRQVWLGERRKAVAWRRHPWSAFK